LNYRTCRDESPVIRAQTLGLVAREFRYGCRWSVPAQGLVGIRLSAPDLAVIWARVRATVDAGAAVEDGVWAGPAVQVVVSGVADELIGAHSAEQRAVVVAGAAGEDVVDAAQVLEPVIARAAVEFPGRLRPRRKSEEVP